MIRKLCKVIRVAKRSLFGVKICTIADFFVAGGRWAGTMAWPLSTPRAPDDSQVSVWSAAAGIKVDIDAWSMGCGWLDPSWTDSPSL